MTKMRPRFVSIPLHPWNLHAEARLLVGEMRFDTVEMRNVGGDWFSTAQQIAITAVHSADTVLHETNDLRAAG
jgi:hypothetical protein